MKYRNVTILGAGAIGSYLIWGFSQKPEIEWCIAASGKRKQRLETDGLWINGKQYFPKTVTPKEAHGTDLLIVALKYGALRDALSEIGEIVSERTTVMSLMNGVDSEEIIASAIGEEPLVYSVIKIASERNGNRIVFDPEAATGITYGEKDPKRGTKRTDALNELFSGTGLHYRSSDKILTEIWAKFLRNVRFNLTQAILGCGLGAVRDSAHAAFIQEKLGAEVELLAKAKGIDLSKCDKSVPSREQIPDRTVFSTLQDLKAKRHTEVEMFSGAIIRMGKELGIPVPYNEMAYHIIRALEEKNDGLFDYS